MIYFLELFISLFCYLSGCSNNSWYIALNDHFQLSPLDLYAIVAKCWQGCGGRGSLHRGWWECKVVQPLGKQLVSFLKRKHVPIWRLVHRSSGFFVIIVKDWKQPKCSSIGEQNTSCDLCIHWTTAKYWKRINYWLTQHEYISIMLSEGIQKKCTYSIISFI